MLRRIGSASCLNVFPFETYRTDPLSVLIDINRIHKGVRSSLRDFLSFVSASSLSFTSYLKCFTLIQIALSLGKLRNKIKYIAVITLYLIALLMLITIFLHLVNHVIRNLSRIR